jgi:transposase
LSDFQKGQIVGEHLAGASVTKMTTLLGVSRAAISKVIAYTNHGKTSSVKRNSGRKPKLSERDCRTPKRTVSQNHKTTGAKVRAQHSS